MTRKQDEIGRLLQINTGEGKTLLIQMICAYFALKGKSVDVVTSSVTLAERDSKEGENFFDALGLSVGFVSGTPEKKIFESNILFGTVHSFCSARLHKFTAGEDIMLGRKSDFLVVDEVDSMMIDKPEIQTIISSASFFSSATKMFLNNIWTNMKILLNSFKIKGVHTKKDKAEGMLCKMAEQMIGSEQFKSNKKFIRKNFKTWVHNATRAYFELVENRDYVITKNPKTGLGKVKIINIDTGETQKNMKWSDGLHHFVELKHGIHPDSVTSSSFFEHHVNFFKSYGTDLVGLTGTLGSKICAEFLSSIYKVECFKIPTFKQKKFIQLDPIICTNQQKWFQEILNEIETLRRFDRPSLVLFQNIFEGNNFCALLQSKNISFLPYLRSDKENHLEQIENLKSKSVVVATNLAGRGTDFKISEPISKRGGLHVIMTFVASNMRVEKQAFGRAARKGELGTGRLILTNANSDFLNQHINLLVQVNMIVSIWNVAINIL